MYGIVKSVQLSLWQQINSWKYYLADFKFASEQSDSHDGEDEPEDEADHQHVEDCRNRLKERVNHDLHAQISTQSNPRTNKLA